MVSDRRLACRWMLFQEIWSYLNWDYTLQWVSEFGRHSSTGWHPSFQSWCTKHSWWALHFIQKVLTSKSNAYRWEIDSITGASSGFSLEGHVIRTHWLTCLIILFSLLYILHQRPIIENHPMTTSSIRTKIHSIHACSSRGRRIMATCIETASWSYNTTINISHFLFV